MHDQQRGWQGPPRRIRVGRGKPPDSGFHGQDDTFGLLADAVGDSGDMVEERSTGGERLHTVRALLAISDRVQFGRHIGALLRRDLVADNLADIRAAVERGCRKLAGEQVSYDLGLQLALVIAAAHRGADSTWALDAAQRARCFRSCRRRSSGEHPMDVLVAKQVFPENGMALLEDYTWDEHGQPTRTWRKGV